MYLYSLSSGLCWSQMCHRTGHQRQKRMLCCFALSSWQEDCLRSKRGSSQLREGRGDVLCCTISGLCLQSCIPKKYKVKKLKLWTVCPLFAPWAWVLSVNRSGLWSDWLRCLLGEGNWVLSCQTDPPGMYSENSRITITVLTYRSLLLITTNHTHTSPLSLTMPASLVWESHPSPSKATLPSGQVYWWRLLSLYDIQWTLNRSQLF